MFKPKWQKMDDNGQVLLIDNLSILCCIKDDLLEFLVHF